MSFKISAIMPRLASLASNFRLDPQIARAYQPVLPGTGPVISFKRMPMLPPDNIPSVYVGGPKAGTTPNERVPMTPPDNVFSVYVGGPKAGTTGDSGRERSVEELLRDLANQQEGQLPPKPLTASQKEQLLSVVRDTLGPQRSVWKRWRAGNLSLGRSIVEWFRKLFE